MIDFPISGNDFRISEIDFPISGNVLDFPISGNQFPISENRHPTEAGHSATLQHRPTTPPPINNGPQLYQSHLLVDLYGPTYTGDPLHSRAACTQPCNVNTHSRAHCSPGARLCEQWGHGCVNNGARLCASARLCRGSPVTYTTSVNRSVQPTIIIQPMISLKNAHEKFVVLN